MPVVSRPSIMAGRKQLFRYARCNILGMVHVPALPGSPASRLAMPEILEHAATEAALLAKESWAKTIAVFD